MKNDVKIEDLFQEHLETLYDAENQIVGALPKMISAASSEDLASAFGEHLEQTREHVKRLESIFESTGTQPNGRDSEGIKGLLADGEKIVSHFEKSPMLDVALAAAGRKVEHWEIAAYESLIALAEILGQQDAVEKLQATLEEELGADETLAETSDTLLTGGAMGSEADLEEIDIEEEEDEEVA